MAIVQVSRITNRKGLTEDLPQLSGAELGWCTDSRRLFIGNGTVAEGAPIIGNTEVLTEFSDISQLSTYTYQDIAVGYAAQTGPTAGDPVVRALTAKLDDQASVRDFGAVGDGITDDTAAINRAMYQLYCVQDTTQTRRSLFFPAGTYRVTSSLVIPPYAKLIGEGQNHVFITSSAVDWVAQFGDSLQQSGASLGFNATLPRDIEISGMTFQTLANTDLFLVRAAQQCWFTSVAFAGPYSISTIQGPSFDPNGLNDTACVRIGSLGSTQTRHITFDRCTFQGLARGISTTINNVNADTQGITVMNCNFDTLYSGVELGVGTIATGDGTTGVRIVHNMFDNIFAQGVRTVTAPLTVTAYNVFYDVGDSISTGTPSTAVIDFGSDDSVSVGDMFARTDTQNALFPRVLLSGTNSALGSGLQLGGYYRDRGHRMTLEDRFSTQPVFSISTAQARAFKMSYTINFDDNVRTGVLTVTTNQSDGSSLSVAYDDEYMEAEPTFITLSAQQIPQSPNPDLIEVDYYTNTGFGGTPILTYSIQQLS